MPAKLNIKFVKLFLRVAIAVAFLSAVADRFGIWGDAWGNMESFSEYTHQLLPWLSADLAMVAGWMATIAELVFGLLLLIGWKVKLMANLSGVLLLCFALAMWSTLGIKAPLNYSVFSASAAAFALATMKVRFLEI